MSRGFDSLPSRWRQDRLVASDRHRLDGALVLAEGEDVLVLAHARRRGHVVVGYGQRGAAAAALTRLAQDGELRAPLDWLSLPRDVDLPARTADLLGVEPLPGWDWLSTAAAPALGGPVDRVERLTAADVPLVRDCLEASNPDSDADPAGAHEVAWWGLREGERLLGVIGASARGGDEPDATTWHLHGLGVCPEARGRGVGRALTSVATRDGVAAGAPWVSLGVWADNAAALALYGSLGFRTDHRRRSYRPRGHESLHPV